MSRAGVAMIDVDTSPMLSSAEAVAAEVLSVLLPELRRLLVDELDRRGLGALSVDVETAARITGLSERRVRDLVRDGSLPLLDVGGGRWLISRQALAELPVRYLGPDGRPPP